MPRSLAHKKIMVIAGILLCVGIAGVSWRVFFLESDQQNLDSSRHQARIVKDFELKDSLGRSHRFSKLSKSFVMLHFWASWCPPCLNEIPQWVELATSFKGKPLKLVAVSLDQTWEDAEKILPTSKLSPNILSLLDPAGKIPDQLGTYQYPETYLISQGPKQRVLMKWIGPQNWGSVKMTESIERAMATDNAHSQNSYP